MTLGRRWAFGSSTFDERSLQLVVDGEIVDLERKPLEVMVYLLRHAGRVVTKNELLENLWPGRILSETVLTRCISLLRQALKDESRKIIETVHGYGYRLAIHVRTEEITPPRSGPFAVGDSPPLRPQWKLVELLSRGDNGDVWLARHEDESRVFKIATSDAALASLKREVALYRVLHRALGDSAPIVKFYDWNLEQAPYLIETEYVEDRDLATWAEGQGGLKNLSIEQRLAIAAQLADAVAAVHSAGVLHGDLKPENTLIRRLDSGDLHFKLSGFRHGDVLVQDNPANLGVAEPRAIGRAIATLYSAPEIAADQPSTIKADVYSLGVILYQLVAGDLKRSFAPDWESDVGDEVLRKDIADAAAGDPSRRIADAIEVVTRLRSLHSRKQLREAEIQARRRAERARKALHELAKVRAYAVTLLVLVVLAVGAGIAAFQARNRALVASASAKAVNEFITNDVLRVDPAKERPAETSYENLLGRAAAQVDTRFKDQTEAAASVHWLLGRRYHELGRIETAAVEYERAAALFERTSGRTSESTMLALDRLAMIYVDRGRVAEALKIGAELKQSWATLHGDRDPSTLLLRCRYARILLVSGDLTAGEAELRRVLEDIPAASPANSHTREHLKDWLGLNRMTDISNLNDAAIATALEAVAEGDLGTYLAEYADAYGEGEQKLRASLQKYTQLLGERSEPTLVQRFSLGAVLASAGKYAESEALLVQSLQLVKTELPPGHYYHAIVKLLLGRLREEQHRAAEAKEFLLEGLNSCVEGCSPRIKSEFLWTLGSAYQELGMLNKAIEALQGSLRIYEDSRGKGHIGTLKRRVSLADALREAGRDQEARRVLTEIDASALAKLPPDHMIQADIRRIEGFIAMDHEDFDAAVALFQESARIIDLDLDSTHWRVKRAHDELSRAHAILKHRGRATNVGSISAST